ncbi:flagellar biosynthetic protein FliO [Microbacterium sp. MYb62]|uniref:FliO/MopB family protein n=1 Tax=Microbacterium sp. MYb62 TaxID=1848690 RepID=UPI000CFC131B|nr:flagellar biosynthetic protein FliO [Microbacterium sp. MYb62]PRB16060.1 flagellar biosynthetic protein FliO [Microbacterium sp. MYb62]
MLSLAAVLGVLWYLQRRVARTQARRRDSEAITVLGRQGVGPKAQIVVIQTEDARYVLGVTEHGVNVVDRLPVKAGGPSEETARPARSAAASEAASDAEEFERILAATALTETTGAPAADPMLRRRVRHRNDPLRGSILSPETWRQTAEAIRRTR